MTPSDWIAIIGTVATSLAGGVGAYIAIRVDLARVKGQLEANALRTQDAYDSAKHAHVRIDALRSN